MSVGGQLKLEAHKPLTSQFSKIVKNRAKLPKILSLQTNEIPDDSVVVFVDPGETNFRFAKDHLGRAPLPAKDFVKPS
jgi:hypothetical protein